MGEFMKKHIIYSIIIAFIVSIAPFSYSNAATHVDGYSKKNGSYVEPHYRSDRNDTKSDNWSTKGNTNPFTGEKGDK